MSRFIVGTDVIYSTILTHIYAHSVMYVYIIQHHEVNFVIYDFMWKQTQRLYNIYISESVHHILWTIYIALLAYLYIYIRFTCKYTYTYTYIKFNVYTCKQMLKPLRSTLCFCDYIKVYNILYVCDFCIVSLS